MSQKHTPEPWSTDGRLTRVIFDSKGVSIGSMHEIEDTKRAVACVNAMEGVEDPQAVREAWEAWTNPCQEKLSKWESRIDVQRTIEALKSENRDIREVIQADPNESTFDEVQRLKARYDKAIRTLKICKTGLHVAGRPNDMVIALIDDVLNNAKP